MTNSLLEKAGMPAKLSWGFLGVMIFMMGDGIEQTWLSSFITSHGFDSATLFAVYGLAVGISGWLSGVIAESFGIKRTMTAGFILFLVGVLSFAFIGLENMSYPVLLASYAIKGLGFPLFAYSFMVWITYRVEQKRLSSAQGWFWFVYTGGIDVLGSYFGIFAYKNFGPQWAMMFSVALAVLGAIFVLFVNKSPEDNLFADSDNVKGSKIKEFLKGLTILKREPKVLLGSIVRIVNTTSNFAFIVFMPLYMKEYGISDGQWSTMWATIFLFNIAFNLIFGIIGDKFGWNRTVSIFGCIGCAITVPLFYFAPQIFPNYWFILICGALWTICLAGFVPLSALVPSLVKSDKGAALSMLNLGAGISYFLGPLLVKIFVGPLGYSGIVWILVGLYLTSAVLMHFLKK